MKANNIETGEPGAQPIQWQNGVGRGGAGFRPSTVLMCSNPNWCPSGFPTLSKKGLLILVLISALQKHRFDWHIPSLLGTSKYYRQSTPNKRPPVGGFHLGTNKGPSVAMLACPHESPEKKGQ